MKQFFENYGAVALGILALLVLIAMITPVGNIIKTSLQGAVQTFSTQIEAQQNSVTDINMGRFSTTLMPINMFQKGTGEIWNENYGTTSYESATDTYTIRKTIYDGEFSYRYGFSLGVQTFIKDHVYFVVLDFKSTVSNPVEWEFPGYRSPGLDLTLDTYNTPNQWKKVSGMVKAPITDSQSVIIRQEEVQAIETREYRNAQLYDLTEIYGAGNEPTNEQKVMEDLYL